MQPTHFAHKQPFDAFSLSSCIFEDERVHVWLVCTFLDFVQASAIFRESKYTECNQFTLNGVQVSSNPFLPISMQSTPDLFPCTDTSWCTFTSAHSSVPDDSLKRLRNKVWKRLGVSKRATWFSQLSQPWSARVSCGCLGLLCYKQEATRCPMQ